MRGWMSAALMGLLILPFFGACNTVNVDGPTAGVRPHAGAPGHSRMQYDRAVIVDNRLQVISGEGQLKASKIFIEGNYARRSATGTLEVIVQIRNRTDYPLRIQGRTSFFDSAMVPIERTSAWKAVFLPANSMGTYLEFSTKVGEVAHFYTEIREGD